MGMMSPPEICHVSGLITKNYESGFDLAEYTVEIKGQTVLFRFHWNHKNSPFVEDNKHILNGLLLNNSFPKEYGNLGSPVLDNLKLEKVIRDSIYPESPEDKINSLLKYLHSLQKFEGSQINFPDNEEKKDLANRLYFKNYQELVFYLFTLKDMGLINGLDTTTREGASITNIKLTYSGLSKVVEINESGSQSDRCFIAMSFSDSQSDTRESIKKTIKNSGFDPILIDEQHFDSDVTINDALIAELKKSKFVVADFTEHKHGVYFEAGFALGLKRPVIYMCRSTEFEKTHFDTNHYPHIIYDGLQELEEKLTAKIEAWIK